MAEILGHTVALDPDNKQATHLAKAAGIARFAYNWALAEWGRQYEAWKKNPSLPRPSELSLRRQLNAIKHDEFPWMLEVSKCAPQEAIRQLGQAFRNFFVGRANYPRFRRKFSDDRFRLYAGLFRVEGDHIKIPRLKKAIRMHETVRFTGKIVSVTIFLKAGRWYASFNVETPDWSRAREAENQGPVGVDLGVTALATLSTGEIIAAPRPYRKAMARLGRLQRELARKMKGSTNRRKLVLKIAKLHTRIANIRQDCLHKLTTQLARCFELIGIENLNVAGMLRNRRIARAIADLGWYEFRRQLEYKVARFGGRLVVAGRFFPSSSACSGCGYREGRLPLDVRLWECSECGKYHDRDVNAAVNLKNLAVSSTVTACGWEGSARVA